MNGAGLSGEGASLQNLQGSSTLPRASNFDYELAYYRMCSEVSRLQSETKDDHIYRDKFIALNKAVTALKRGTPTTEHLETLGYSEEDFNNANQYLVAFSFDVKERERFIKKLESMKVDLFDAFNTKSLLDFTRRQLEKAPEDSDLLQQERILGNLLFNCY